MDKIKKKGGNNSYKESKNVDKTIKFNKSNKGSGYSGLNTDSNRDRKQSKSDKGYTKEQRESNFIQKDTRGQQNKYKGNKENKVTDSKKWASNENSLKESKISDRGYQDKQVKTMKYQEKDYKGNDFKEKTNKGKEFKGKDFKEKVFKGKDFKGKEFKGKDFKGKDFKEKEFKGKDFKEKDFKEKEFKGKDFKEKDYNEKFSKEKDYRKDKSYTDKKQGEQPNNRLREKAGNDKFKSEFKTGNKNSKCPVMYKCGGCQLLHLDYAKQLKDKQKKVEELLSQFGKVEPIIGMDNPDHYRNKVHAVFDHDRKGNAISGVYEPGTHIVVPVDSCLIENEKADEIIVSIRGLLKSFKIKTYDEDTEYGLLRHVLIRTGHKSGQIMVVLVLASPILPSKNNFVKALRKLHPEITTIIINVNNKNTSMILGDKEQVIYGKGYIEDTLCEKVFHISPKSFYQVNPVQTEVLYKKAIDLAGLTGKETIIDAYCGIGTIGIIASDFAKKVIGVELNVDAVKDANSNAKRNQISNIDFYNKDAGEFMSQMAAQDQKAEVVFMDPPRAGSDEKFLTSLCTLAPERIVYISCNPVTLARDLEFIVKNGYKVNKMIPVDMFPNTSHVEVIIMMTYCGRDKK